MFYLPNKKIITLLLLVIGLFYVTGSAYALDAAVSIPISSGKDGDLVSFVNGKYTLTSVEYDRELYGVIVSNPAFSFQDKNYTATDSRLVMTTGETYVNVSGVNGVIKQGDYIASSKTLGVGQKADRPGVVVGIALQDFPISSKNAVGRIKVMVNIKSAVVDSNVRGNLISALREGSYAPFLTPLTSLRYILAALVTASSFIIGFYSFSKASGNSMQALGRNPLARKDINRSLIFSFFLTFAVLIVGLGVSYLILVL